MKNLRQRLIGEIAVRAGLDISGIDINSLLRRLVLFDTVIIKSVRLKEIPFLARAFGYEGVMELLSSAALEIYCEGVSITQNFKINDQRILPVGQYNFASVDIADHEKYMHDCLQPVGALEGTTLKEAQKLKRAIIAKLIRPPSGFSGRILDQFDRDLRSGSPAIPRAINLRFQELYGRPAPQFSLRLDEVRERTFRADTDLFEKSGLSQDATNDLIEVGLAAIGGLNQRLAEMRSVSALSGFGEAEIALFEDKLEFLAHACSLGPRTLRAAPDGP